MKTIGFIGAHDKIDLIIYVAKLLVELNKKVMIIDATTLQKAKYVVPTISPSTTYVTNFEGIDVAVGFYDYESIKEYLGIERNATLEYDYILLDIDSAEAAQNFDIKIATQNYFVTGFDAYSLKRGLEILSGIEEPIPLTKILFSKDITKEENEYLNYLSLGYKVIWNNEEIYFPFEQGDQTVIFENQRVAKIKFKKLTQFYKQSLMYLAEKVLGPNDSGDLKKAFKQIEKGV